jgi:hypothetical protein
MRAITDTSFRSQLQRTELLLHRDRKLAKEMKCHLVDNMRENSFWEHYVKEKNG